MGTWSVSGLNVTLNEVKGGEGEDPREGSRERLGGRARGESTLRAKGVWGNTRSGHRRKQTTWGRGGDKGRDSGATAVIPREIAVARSKVMAEVMERGIDSTHISEVNLEDWAGDHSGREGKEVHRWFPLPTPMLLHTLSADTPATEHALCLPQCTCGAERASPPPLYLGRG